MDSFWVIIIMCGMAGMFTMASPWVKKGRDMWESHRMAGKKMINDYDEEQKEIDKYTR